MRIVIQCSLLDKYRQLCPERVPRAPSRRQMISKFLIRLTRSQTSVTRLGSSRSMASDSAVCGGVAVKAASQAAMFRVASTLVGNRSSKDATRMYDLVKVCRMPAKSTAQAVSANRDGVLRRIMHRRRSLWDVTQL